MRVLFDGDLIVYKAGFGAQKNNENPPVAHALYNCRNLLKNYLKTLDKYFTIEDYKIFLSSDETKNFRYDIAKTKPYKGNRKDLSKPIHYDDIKKYLIEHWEAITVENKEADDELGILCSQNPENTIIVSMDKDLRMIPGWHYEMGERPPYFVEDPGILILEKVNGRKSKLFGTGIKWLCAQMVLGDVADNIPGIPGYGDVKTYRLLNKYVTTQDLLLNIERIYKKHGLENRLIEVMRLLWIQRHKQEEAPLYDSKR